MSHQVHHLSCPACAGVLEEAGEGGTTTCPYCGARVLITREGTPERFFVPPVLADPSQADASLRRCLVGSPAPLGYPLEDATRCRLLFLPFYEVVGTSLVRVLDHAGTEEEDTRVDLRTLYQLQPALREDRFGLGHLATRGFRDQGGLRLQPFHPDRVAALGVAFEPDYSPEQLRANLERSAAEVRGRKGVDVRLVDARTHLVYLPVWEVRHRFEGRLLTSYVEALQGEVLRGDAPESRLGRNLLAHLLLLLVAVSLGVVVRALATTLQVTGAGPVSNLTTVDLVLQDGLALLLGLAGATLLLAVFRRYLRPRGVTLTGNTFQLGSGDGGGILDGLAEVLEVAVRSPVALLHQALRGGPR